jgi:hypothetical protein
MFVFLDWPQATTHETTIWLLLVVFFFRVSKRERIRKTPQKPKHGHPITARRTLLLGVLHQTNTIETF